MKWHNGPNGPGLCRARKGNCPYGGADSHFESEAEAKKAYESARENEYGLLPKVSNGKQRPIKAVTYLDNGIHTSLSNYVITGTGGSEESREYFRRLTQNANLNADDLANVLNEDERILGNWSSEEQSENEITLKNIDNFGNIHYLKVSAQPKEKEGKPGDLLSYQDNGIRMRLSNYVITGDGGKGESEDYFKSLIKNSSINNDTLVSALNKDDRVLGNWSFESENDDTIKLKNVDNFGNENFLEIARDFLK